MDASGVEPELPCMNCSAVVPSDKAQLFSGVFVCGSCYETAVRLQRRLERELKHLLTLSNEAIRVALVQGKLHPGEYKHEDVPKDQLLRSLSDIVSENQSVLPKRG